MIHTLRPIWIESRQPVDSYSYSFLASQTENCCNQVEHDDTCSNPRAECYSLSVKKTILSSFLDRNGISDPKSSVAFITIVY